MRVEISERAPSDWDEFAASQRTVTAWHLAPVVGIGQNAFGLRTRYLCVRNESRQIAGALALVEQSSKPFGRFLTSLPFVNYGGILATDPEVVSALADAAAELGREWRARHVELRHTEAGPQMPWPSRLDKASMLLPLPANEDLLAKQLGAKLRSQVKRAERENPEVIWGGSELLPGFHRVFSQVMRDLGTPVYPISFFAVVLQALGSLARVVVIRAAGRDQAAALVVRHPDRLEVPWAAAGTEAKRRALNMRLYWELLRHALESGAPAFDFGRSTIDSGTYRFKAQWGARPLQLHWHYSLPPGSELPMLNAHNSKFRLASSLWRRLPLWAANRIGPHIIRHLP